MRAVPKFTWGAIFADREAARFRRVATAAAELTGLALPPEAAALLADQRLAEETFVMWDLIHDRTHMHGDLPFDPFMIKQRMPYFLYSLEELRCDLTAFREAVRLEGTGIGHARLVQYAILFDRIFRFAITGSRVRNYDGLGGQLLFAWLHQRRVLHWTDNRLTVDWADVADAVTALGEAIDDLYWRSIDRPEDRPLAGRLRPGQLDADAAPGVGVGAGCRRAAGGRPAEGPHRRGAARRVPAVDVLRGAVAQARRRGPGHRRYHRDLTGLSGGGGTIGRVTTLHDPTRRGFASDNYAGVHPEVLQALADANGGHQIAYGDDVYTARLHEVMAAHFGAGVEVFPVFNGTGANVLSLQSMLPRWGGVVCAETAHINVDENGAPERVGGIKLLTVPTPDGKLTPELIDRQAYGFGDEHRAQPLAVSITQSTELGTLYTPGPRSARSPTTHTGLGMTLHLDGSRISNAAAALGLPLAAFTTDVGVDVLSFGGTKNGLLAAEAVVVLEPRRRHRAEVPAQDEHAAGVEDAVLLRAAHRAARGRPLAAVGAARERDGGPADRRGRRPGRGHGDPADGGQRGVRGAAAGRRRSGPRAVHVLRLGRSRRRGALDVRLGHHRGRRRRIRPVTQGGSRRVEWWGCLRRHNLGEGGPVP